MLCGGLILLAGLGWSAQTLFGIPPAWEPDASALVALGSFVVLAVTVVALLLSPGKWVRNNLVAVAFQWLIIALLAAIDLLWAVAFLAGIAGIALAWMPGQNDWFRQIRPDRVPVRATTLALGLLWTPTVVGMSSFSGIASTGWALAGFGLVGGWAYARTVPGVLWILRLGTPALGLAAVTGLHHLWSVPPLLALIVGLTYLAWSAEARTATEPPGPRRVDPITVLPELAPPGVMESAGYDRSGRPLRETD